MRTTLRSLKMWSENRKVDLVELGFTEEDGDVTVSIQNEKLKDIFNLSETCISRPAAVFFDPWIAFPQKTTKKVSLTTTMESSISDEGAIRCNAKASKKNVGVVTQCTWQVWV